MNILRGIFAAKKRGAARAAHDAELPSQEEPQQAKPCFLDVTTRSGYDIACALRGPDWTRVASIEWDKPEVALKHAFTERLRALVGIDHNVAPVRSRVLDLDTALALRGVRKQSMVRGPASSFFLTHFLMHAEDAARALGDEQLARLASAVGTGRVNEMPSEEIIRLAGGERESATVGEARSDCLV